ncbi:hypothetical protein [Adhaeribacter radiodurans]|uniref:Uncharacterized protein n=1 Tax=Adhaeribacter radiodurans TaxID=2745197 RepID=A0A7L7L6H8_9BACT|nr:hypothetical protein [Adhaeribacter radiodurans]QMU28115.1 hypothetical protein HUW48_08675 [Adhaeribacter radiodurans]
MEKQKIDNIIVYTKRLKKHFDYSKQIYDENELIDLKVSLIDLAHTLRNWVDMKMDVQKFLEEYAPGTRFNSQDYTGSLKKLIRPYNYVIAPIPLGLTINHKTVDGKLDFMLPTDNFDYATGVQCKINKESSELSVRNFWFVYKHFDNSQMNIMFKGFILKKLNFLEWLGAEAVKIAKLNNSGVMERNSISRETLIKRVSNILGGSHPEGLEVKHTLDNEHVRYILEHSSFINRPLPYFILMKFASDLLDVFTPICEKLQQS